MTHYFVAVRRDGADPLFGPYHKIALPATTMAEAMARLPSYLHSSYAVFAMSPRAAARVESLLRPNARCP